MLVSYLFSQPGSDAKDTGAPPIARVRVASLRGKREPLLAWAAGPTTRAGRPSQHSTDVSMRWQCHLWSFPSVAPAFCLPFSSSFSLPLLLPSPPPPLHHSTSSLLLVKPPFPPTPLRPPPLSILPLPRPQQSIARAAFLMIPCCFCQLWGPGFLIGKAHRLQACLGKAVTRSLQSSLQRLRSLLLALS